MSVVFTPGMQGSASTWVYNVCRELLLRQYETVSVFYCDSTAELSKELAHVEHAAVVKMHQPDQGIIAAIANGEAPAVITVRDPRDSVVSLMERFNYPISALTGSLVVASVTQIARIPPKTSLFFNMRMASSTTLQPSLQSQNLLGINISADQREEIFSRYRRTASGPS